MGQSTFLSSQLPYGDDHFGNRLSFAQNIADLLSSDNQNLIVALNADWGMGKTWFIENFLVHKLDESGMKPILINPWEDDYSEEPFAVIMGHMYDFFGKIENTVEKKEDFQNAVKELKGIVAKLVSNGAIDLDAVDSKYNPRAHLQNQIDEHSNIKKIIKDFKKHVTKTVSFLSKAVIIVDELDRCRPSFAVRFLERLKHFFDIDRLHFIIAIDKEQLGYAVSGLYGERYNGQIYLDRFFDYQFHLPANNYKSYITNRINKEYGIEPKGGEQVPTSYAELINWAQDFNFFELFQPISSRSVEYLLKKLTLAFKYYKQAPRYCSPTFLAFLILMQLEMPALYRDYITKRTSIKSTLDWLRVRVRAGSYDTYLSDYKYLVTYAITHSLGEPTYPKDIPNPNGVPFTAEDIETMNNQAKAFRNQCLNDVWKVSGLCRFIDLGVDK